MDLFFWDSERGIFSSIKEIGFTISHKGKKQPFIMYYNGLTILRKGGMTPSLEWLAHYEH